MSTYKPVSVLLVCFNEVEIIESVARDFYERIVSNIPGSQMIISEDGSTDGTKDVLRRLAQELPEFVYDEGESRRGYTGAYRSGVSIAKNDMVFFCDASGKHDANDLFRMLPLMTKNDMVIGYKEHRADPFYRLVLSRVFNFLVNSYFGVSYRDINCPMRLFRKKAFMEIAQENWQSKALINFEITLRFLNRGYKVIQIPIAHYARTNGGSRGLPLKTLPRVILGILQTMPHLKTELKNLNSFRKLRQA